MLVFELFAVDPVSYLHRVGTSLLTVSSISHGIEATGSLCPELRVLLCYTTRAKLSQSLIGFVATASRKGFWPSFHSYLMERFWLSIDLAYAISRLQTSLPLLMFSLAGFIHTNQFDSRLLSATASCPDCDDNISSKSHFVTWSKEGMVFLWTRVKLILWCSCWVNFMLGFDPVFNLQRMVVQ